MKPLINIVHTAARVEPDWEPNVTVFALYPTIPGKFIKLMDYLYPQFITHSKVEREDGYTAFVLRPGEDRDDPLFVGTFCGVTLQSVRKSPWLMPHNDHQFFVRALLGGLYLRGYKHHSSVCRSMNYGTLSLWRKLGLGAKEDGARLRSEFATPESVACRTAHMEKSKLDYKDARARAATLLSRLSVAEFLPAVEDMTVAPEYVKVELG